VIARRFLSGTRLRGGLLLVVVFVAGLISALAADRLPGSRGLITVEAPPLPEEISRLHLTVSQEHAVEAILARSRADAGRVLVEMAPRLAAILDSTDAEVRAVLTPAQRVAFDGERRRHRPAFLLRHRSDTGMTIDSIRVPAP
jgi:xanthine/CO dehydrogenase XdhC/CoxF family maturation factor